MPLFTVTDGALRPVPQVRPGPELYEFEIQELIWGNVEAFYGADLLPICKDQRISTGGRPDLVCLDESGRVVVFEVKRFIGHWSANLAKEIAFAAVKSAVLAIPGTVAEKGLSLAEKPGQLAFTRLQKAFVRIMTGGPSYVDQVVSHR